MRLDPYHRGEVVLLSRHSETIAASHARATGICQGTHVGVNICCTILLLYFLAVEDCVQIVFSCKCAKILLWRVSFSFPLPFRWWLLPLNCSVFVFLPFGGSPYVVQVVISECCIYVLCIALFFFSAFIDIYVIYIYISRDEGKNFSLKVLLIFFLLPCWGLHQ